MSGVHDMPNDRQVAEVEDDKRVADDQRSVMEAVGDEAALFASPLPITGERKTTTRTELWVSHRSRSV